MPSQQPKKGGPLSKLGGKLANAHKKVKGQAWDPGNQGLPAGIEGGVAELTECKIGVYAEGKNKGQPYFLAMGVVVSPEVHEGAKIAGLLTKVGPHPLCDTPQATGKLKTFDDHYAWMRNQLLGLGLDVDAIEGTPEDIEAGILAGMEDLKAAGVRFRFRTWKGQKQTTGAYAGREPMVNHEWGGVVDVEANGQPHDEPTSGVDDQTGAKPADTPVDDPPADSEGGELVGDDSMDLDALAEAADGDDEGAREALQTKALELGYTEDDISGADNWTAVAEMIRAKESGEEPADDAPEPPAKGGVYKWNRPGKDPKSKKPFKPVEVEVTRVDVKAEKVDVKETDNPKAVHKAVPFAELEVI